MESNQDNVEKNLKLIAKSSISVFMALVLSKLLVYVYKIIIARNYNSEVYGVFSLASMIANMLVVFFSLGLNEGLLRFIAIYRGNNEHFKIKFIYNFSMKLLIFSSIFGGIFLYLIADKISINIFHDAALIPFLKIFSIAVPIAIISYNFLAFIRAYELVGWYMFISSVARNFLHVVFILLFIFLGFNEQAISWSYVAGFAGMLLFSYILFKSRVSKDFKDKNLDIKEKKNITKEVMNYSLPLIFSSFIFLFFGWVDSFSIGYFKTSAEVGIYNAALPIAMLLSVAPELFIKLFFPLINKEYGRKNFEVIKELSKQISKWIFIINLPILILIIIFPNTIINIIFGPQYLYAASSLRILSLGFFVSVGVGTISLRMISMAGKSKLVLFNVIIASILNLTLNIILIPMEKIGFIENSLGINGAAIATLISLLFVSILQVIQAKHYVESMPVRRSFIRVSLAAVIPSILLLYIRNIFQIKFVSFIIIAFLFSLVYLALIILFKGFDRNDISIFSSIKDKAIKRN